MEKTFFGTIEGRSVFQYQVTNAHGVRLACLDFGATWHGLWVPDGQGGEQNLVMSSPEAADYTHDETNNHGKSIGRVAGRIALGQYQINGQTVTLPLNEGNNTLHGGPHGFSKVFWEAEGSDDTIVFHRVMTSELDGFPGDMDVTITYQLTQDDCVKIAYRAMSNADTLFNPTSHVYFNLHQGDETIEDHILQVPSDYHFALGEEKRPTATLLSNQGTAYDLTQPVALGKVLHQLQHIPEQGFDDVFWLGAHDAQMPVATLNCGRLAVEIYSQRNSLVVFTSNHFGDELCLTTKTSRPYIGIALEPQTAPSAIADHQFGNFELLAQQPRVESITYHFIY